MAIDPARAKTLFLHAADLADPAERVRYLDRECGDDAELRGRVEALLAADGPSGPDFEPDSTGVFGLDPPGPLEVTRTSAPETLQGSIVPVPDDGLPTVGASGVQSPDATLAHAPPAARPAGFVPGQVIAGRYTLLAVLGEGGMGTVYRAEQSQPVRRTVALKLIKLGMDSRTVLARFDAERQALAMMDHPSIARVYDGGATDTGQPFFVMEFVQGEPITDYCDRHRLTVDARLQLFVAACQAVQHAHQKGIIHRDLKPSNVMVTEVDGRPTPKVIDFGVAKATEATLTDQSLGDTGAIVGTPTYMSPEQADPSSMDIDTRTDVYALGVILYELLAGSPPLDASQFKWGALLEMLRMVREVDPSKPSTKVSTADALPSIAANRGIDPRQLSRELRGDLDWIVMKALEKDRTRRYETANGFAADVLRHLASEPVLAAPPSRSYRARKFVRKHRAGVVAASLVLLALVAGVAGTSWGLFAARRSAEAEHRASLVAKENEKKAVAAADEEKKAKETVEAVLRFVEDRIFAAARPKGQEGGLGHDVKLADAIEAALPAIEEGFRGKPLVEACLRKTIGLSFFYLGKPESAAEQQEAAFKLYRRELGPEHSDTLGLMNDLAGSYQDMGRYTEALARQEEALALEKVRLGPDHPETLRGMMILANIYSGLGRFSEAVALNQETLALSKARLGPVHPETLKIMNNLADCYQSLSRNAEAIELRKSTLDLIKAKLGPEHSDAPIGMNNLAGIHDLLGQHAEALKLREVSQPLLKARLGLDNFYTIGSLGALATDYAALGRLAEALDLQKETLALARAKLGPDHSCTLGSLHHLALTYLAAGQRAEALSLLETAADKDPDIWLTLAAVQVWFGEAEAYASTRRRFLASARETQHSRMAIHATIACALRPSSDPAELGALLALGRRAEELDKGAWAAAQVAHGMAAFRNGHFAAADDAFLSCPKASQQDQYSSALAAFYHAMSLFQQGKKDQARDMATKAAARMSPMPRDEQKPNSPEDNGRLIVWLAYKEAKAMIGFDAPPIAPPSAKPDGK